VPNRETRCLPDRAADPARRHNRARRAPEIDRPIGPGRWLGMPKPQAPERHAVDDTGTAAPGGGCRTTPCWSRSRVIRCQTRGSSRTDLLRPTRLPPLREPECVRVGVVLCAAHGAKSLSDTLRLKGLCRYRHNSFHAERLVMPSHSLAGNVLPAQRDLAWRPARHNGTGCCEAREPRHRSCDAAAALDRARVRSDLMPRLPYAAGIWRQLASIAWPFHDHRRSPTISLDPGNADQRLAGHYAE